MKTHGFMPALASVALAAAAFCCSTARADYITFQDGAAGSLPGGGGGLQEQINHLGFQGGNTVTLGADSAGIGSLLDTYYQAQVGSLKGGSTTYYTSSPNSLGSNFFLTAMFGVTEQVTAFGVNSNGTSTEVSSLAAPGSQRVNYFQLYAQTSQTANDDAGTGFHSGTLILSGTVTQLNSNITGTESATTNLVDYNDTGSTATNVPTTGKSIGQPPASGTTTPQAGGGQFTITIQVTSADPNWFPGLISPTKLAFVLPSGSLTDTFLNVDPSANFDLGPLFTPYTPALGNVNGLNTASGGTGKDFQFESDAGATFLTTPEPATVTLMGLGMSGILLALRRRKSKVEA